MAWVFLAVMGTAYAVNEQKKAAKAQRAAQRKQQAMQKLQEARQRRERLRQLRKERAMMANNAANSGMAASSGLLGSMSSTTTGTVDSLVFQNTQSNYNTSIAKDQEKAQDHMANAQFADSITSLASSFVDWQSVGKQLGRSL